MIDSIPDVCVKCGGSDLEVTKKRLNTDEQPQVVTVTCNECGARIANRERLNYKSPVQGETDG